MNKIYDYFKKISSIPRCSHNASLMFEYIVEHAKSKGFEVFTDSFKNVLCVKGEPKVCLQAHYDMVCIGDAPNIEIVENSGTIRAKNSTLGADNGMGMAIMLDCMDNSKDLECLFTSDEEVGLVGAMNLKMQIKSPNLLNLDAEEEGEIYVGCAGSIDILAKMPILYAPLDSKAKLFKISTKPLKGGHSGIDIDKHIPSAIKVLANELLLHDVKIIHIEGGERRNSIAQNAFTIVASEKMPKVQDSRILIEEVLDFKSDVYIQNGGLLIRSLSAFAQGVRSYDKDLLIPSKSINIGIVGCKDGFLTIECMARAMEEKSLDGLEKETRVFFEVLSFLVESEAKHKPWKPFIGDFANYVKSIVETVYPECTFKAIHAGLECGALIDAQNKKIEAVSMGPTIRFPHSLREECDMASVVKMARIVREIIKG
ncbi:MAG: Xaa-His dipeptidase [Sulfurospirillaceae bacterium]|nr:Xaa-His dipeptidase [Sulfurospirillaceae bacterium]MDD3463495.1 Xaa-His dipeptidase [Sulfurospirillaceae bacterium]